ncbi:ROK family protein [Anaerolineales bacterium HSG6]|nr:ROK family protein [Anaerolineales bacterium HSG6]
MTLFGGIEAGGTKFVCAVGSSPDDIRAETRFPTSKPEETINQAIAFFKEHGPVESIGIGAFGPVDPDPISDTYGYITTTPKPYWEHTDLAGPIREAFKVPVGFDTDVNGAALGEYRWGAGQGLHTFIYLTIGTGVGGGIMVNGQLLHGLIHPEVGHILIPHDEADSYAGKCPYHGDCLEGMVAGPSLEERWGERAETFTPDHPAWLLEAKYLAYGLASIVCMLSPQRIIMGGGVMDQAHLFPMIRQNLIKTLNGYVHSPAILENIDQFVVPPVLGNRAGVAGAMALAEQALHA